MNWPPPRRLQLALVALNMLHAGPHRMGQLVDACENYTGKRPCRGTVGKALLWAIQELRAPVRHDGRFGTNSVVMDPRWPVPRVEFNWCGFVLHGPTDLHQGTRGSTDGQQWVAGIYKGSAFRGIGDDVDAAIIHLCEQIGARSVVEA
jgi:hypothetical protein